MESIWSLLLSPPPTDNGWVQELINVMMIIFAVCTTASVIWAVWIGIGFMTASDEAKRAVAKKRLFNAIAILLIVGILFGVLLFMRTLQFNPIEPSTPTVGVTSPPIASSINLNNGIPIDS